jgi:DNA mismatch repair protein MutS2
MRIVAEPSMVTVTSRKDERKARVETAPLPRGPADAASLEIDLRGMTGDEAEMATVAAVDAAVLAEQPFLRIIHGMGTGVVRDRVQRVVSKDRRVSRYAFAPRNQGGTGVTIVEFSA